MPWLLANKKSITFCGDAKTKAERPKFEEQLQDEDCLYGGFISKSVVNLRETLTKYHPQIVKDFQWGWTAVGLTARPLESSSPQEQRRLADRLGPFSPPTVARPWERAPLGLYLLSTTVLRDTWNQVGGGPFPEQSMHKRFSGMVFCDPNLEVHLQTWEEVNWEYTPPKSSAWGALKFLVRGATGH